jgi:ketosteroid isomerase-like protein
VSEQVDQTRQSTNAVLEAAAALVDAFGRHDTAAYFASFAPDATFTFYTAPEPLRSRAEYEEVWATWEREDGFHVVSCVSSDPFVQVVGSAGDIGIVTHRVSTQVRTNEGTETVAERETIVFARGSDGRWQAVHEHLSPRSDG